MCSLNVLCVSMGYSIVVNINIVSAFSKNKCVINLECGNSYLRTPSDILIQWDVQ